jgi:hypothetical protein
MFHLQYFINDSYSFGAYSEYAFYLCPSKFDIYVVIDDGIWTREAGV